MADSAPVRFVSVPADVLCLAVLICCPAGAAASTLAESTTTRTTTEPVVVRIDGGFHWADAGIGAAAGLGAGLLISGGLVIAGREERRAVGRHDDTATPGAAEAESQRHPRRLR